MAIESGVVDELGRKFEGAELVDNNVIAQHLKDKNCDLAFTAYSIEMMRSLDVDSATGSGDDGAATTANTSVVYGEGGTKVLVKTIDLTTALSIEAFTQEQLKAKEAKAKAKAKAKNEEGRENEDRA